MCGISGVFNYGLDARVDRDVVLRMTRTLVHRGPDDESYYLSPDGRVGLGLRRLARPGRGGAIRCESDGGALAVLCDGMPRSERSEAGGPGSDGESTSRVEDLIRARWRQEGESCAASLAGPFAFALYDETRRSLLLARDPIGLKPLYLLDTGSVFVFASEIKAILLHPAVARRLNRSAVPLWFESLATAAPTTLFAGVEKLPPARTLLVRQGNGAGKYRPYWSAESFGELPEPPGARGASEILRDQLDTAVKASLGTLSESALFLAGNLESLSLLAFQGRVSPRPIPAFGVHDALLSPEDGARRNREAARLFRVPFQEPIAEPELTLGALQARAALLEEPSADPPRLDYRAAAEAARRGGLNLCVSALLNDDVLRLPSRRNRLLDLGARWERRRQRSSPFVQSLFGRLGRPFVAPGLRDYFGDLAAGASPGELEPDGVPLRRLRPLLRTPATGAGSANDGGAGVAIRPPAQRPEISTVRRLRSGLASWIPDRLVAPVERSTMAASVECHFPFLAPAVIRLCRQLEAAAPRHGAASPTFSSVIRGLLPAELQADAPRGRDAPGAFPPLEGLGKWVRRIYQHEPGSLGEVFDIQGISDLVDAHDRSAAPGAAWMLLLLLNFGLWHRCWIDEMS